MKNKIFVALVSGAAIVANLALFALASAATSGNLTASGVVNGGSLAVVAVPSNTSLGSATISDVDQVLNPVVATGLNWQDLTDSGNDYQVDLTMTDLSDGAGHTIELENVKVSAVTTGLAALAGSCSTGFSYDSTATAFVEDSVGVSLPFTYVSVDGASADNITHCAAAIGLQLTVNAYQSAGTYSGTLTATIS